MPSPVHVPPLQNSFQVLKFERFLILLLGSCCATGQMASFRVWGITRPLAHALSLNRLAPTGLLAFHLTAAGASAIFHDSTSTRTISSSSASPSSSSSSPSSASSAPGTGAGEGDAGADSGRACESPDAAFRDVMLSRLAALEAEVGELRRAAEAAGRQAPAEGKEGEGDDNGGSARDRGGRSGGKGGGGSTTEAVATGLSALHPKITRLVHSGYLESLHHLRQRLMVDEWEGGGRQRALRRGVAELEAQLAERGEGGGGEGGKEGARGGAGGLPGWEEITELYKNPENLDIISDPRVRMAARATLQRTLDDRYEKEREGATQLAKELADAVTHGPGNMLAGLWGMLPLPSFLKGGK